MLCCVYLSVSGIVFVWLYISETSSTDFQTYDLLTIQETYRLLSVGDVSVCQ